MTRGQGAFWLDSHRHAVHSGAVFFTTPGQVRRWDVKQLEGVCLFFEDFLIKEFLHDDAFLLRLPYGFEDPGYFSRFFRKHQGVSPGVYRRRSRLEQMRRGASYAAWP